MREKETEIMAASASNAESVREDEDELLWAALLRLPSQKQTNFALLRWTVSKLDNVEERFEVIDVRKLDRFNRELIVKRALATTEQDNYKLLSAMKEHLNREDEVGLLWATLSRLLSREERSKAIDVRKLDHFNHELVVKRALATTEQDNYKFLSTINEHLNR
ncbi:unnamed protein product [Camellia sinensis]